MPDFDRLTARISRYLETTGVPAFALGIVQGQELVYARGFGRIGQIGYDSHVDHGGHVNHTVAEQQVSPDTLFPTCSTAKPFVATAILQLVEGGILDLDTPVARYLPWLCYPAGGDASRVTVRHLLTHTSGLSSDPDVPERFFAGKPACLADNLRHDIPGYGAAGRPGEVFWYSNPGFNIAGHLLEHLTGTPFSEVMTERVFTPASMTSTSFDAGFRTDQLIVDSPAPQCLPIPYPAGGAVTSIRDLARFAISHLHGGRLPGGKLLDPATIGLMHSIQADAWSRSPRCGMGSDSVSTSIGGESWWPMAEAASAAARPLSWSPRKRWRSWPCSTIRLATGSRQAPFSMISLATGVHQRERGIDLIPAPGPAIRASIEVRGRIPKATRPRSKSGAVATPSS